MGGRALGARASAKARESERGLPTGEDEDGGEKDRELDLKRGGGRAGRDADDVASSYGHMADHNAAFRILLHFFVSPFYRPL